MVALALKMAGVDISTRNPSVKAPELLRSPSRRAQKLALALFYDQYDWMTRGPDNGNEWTKYCVVPHAHPLPPLVLYFFFLFIQGRKKYTPPPWRPPLFFFFRV